MKKYSLLVVGAVAILVIIWVLSAQNIRLARDLQRYETKYRKELFDSIKTLHQDRILIDAKIDSLKNIVEQSYKNIKADIKKIQNAKIIVPDYTVVSDSALVARLLSDFRRN
jgi:low affinity Fe/Cu permease